MALIRALPRFDGAPLLQGERVYLRYPMMGDFEGWASLREESRAFLAPWEPTWPADDLTRASFRRRLRRYSRDVREDLGYAFLIYARGSGRVLGGATLSNVRRGVSQACALGYWIGEPYAGQGLMKEAVRLLIPFVFDKLALHRIEAACIPDNERSRRLLLGMGFKEEGVARAYLRINGAWRDHALFALVDSDLKRG